MKLTELLNKTLQAAAIAGIVFVNMSVGAVVWPSTPLGSTINARPMTMLVAGKDHKLFYEAYNDSSDIDGDGTLDTRFKPSIVYYGLYDSTLCYSYSSSDSRFSPRATAGALGVCSNSTDWSGNWLNYMTTSRIDALRKVLYGGHREIDTTSLTVLRRAYIPQDAHSWGKEYHNQATDGYNIEDYTPLSLPSANNRRHFFGNLTPNEGVNCTTLNNCSNIQPVLRIRENVGNDYRIWQWASKERPVLSNGLQVGNNNSVSFPSGTGNQRDFVVRVEVCTSTFNAGCRQYPNGSSPVYKPIGLLHEYGENDAMLFGLMTGSYDRHMSGGRLRKVVSSFASEVNTTTGVFNTAAPIVNTFNNLRIRGYNQSSNSNEYRSSNPYAASARAPTEGEFVDWGNPIGEMLYEATRYFAGRGAPTAAFAGATTLDSQVGLTSATWDDPYSSTSAARAPYCSRASFLTISDINPSFDSDTVPGSAFTNYSDGGQLPGLNAAALGSTITGIEDSGVSTITGQRFIGQSGTGTGSFDSAPTAKSVTSLGNIRGLAPEDPSKQGSYYAASVAYYARTNDIRASGSTALQGTQTVDNYVVALSSPLPKIEAALPNGRVITLVPFSKTVEFNGNVSSAKGDYQPTNQIVDFYVETIANSGPGNMDPGVNGGRYYAEFQINFEDVEQGGDHDMDAIARYVIQANSDNSLSVTVIPTYQAGGMKQNMGYVISGTNRDGVYLVAKDEGGGPRYFLNVPAGQSAGYCDVASPPAACGSLPTIGQAAPTFTFTPNIAGNGGATLLKDPLWYAAKYGGFVDRNNSRTPDLPVEWDADGDGVPDTYFLVQNPSTLRQSLQKAFNSILERSGSGGNVVANSTQVASNSLVFQGLYSSARWSGELVGYPVSASGLNRTPLWRTTDAGRIPAFAARRLFYGADTGSSKPFEWAQLSAAERALLNNDQTLVNYLRGERTREVQNGGTLRDRPANTVLGDIVHSSPAYVQDSNTVFVGANDGMLHAFNAATGTELFGYMPRQMLPRVRVLADLNYNDNHEYFVDGDIAVSSVAQTTRNYLVATMGRGGRGIFGLDVTNPATFSAGNVLWEYTAATDPDLGFMIGSPKIARLRNGDWAAIVANGFNSTNQGAALYVFNLATGAVIAKLDTGVANRGNNGLSTPGLRLDGSGFVEAVYAGDLRGNLWKFDLSSSSPASWAVAFSGQPLFQARDALGNPQPITAPITSTANTVATDPNFGRTFVHFGTGSLFQSTDPSSTARQTWYGLIDQNAPIPNRSNLVQRTFSVTTTQSGTLVRSLSAAVANDMSGRSGFFIDLPETGERMVTASTYGYTTQPAMFASSAIPLINECMPGGRGFVNIIDPFTGAQLSSPNLDIDGDGSFDDEYVNGVYASSIDLGIGISGQPTLVGQFFIVGGTGGDNGTIAGGSTPIPTVGARGRVSWREIIRD